MKTFCYDLDSQVEQWNKVHLKIGASAIALPDHYKSLTPAIITKLHGFIQFRTLWDYDRIVQRNPYVFNFLQWLKTHNILETWYPIHQCIKDLTSPSIIRTIKQNADGPVKLFELLDLFPYDNKSILFEAIYEHYIPHMSTQQIETIKDLVFEKAHVFNVLKNLHHDHAEALLFLTSAINFDHYFFWWHQQSFLIQERHVRMWGQNKSTEIHSLLNHPAHYLKKEMLHTWLTNNHHDWLIHNLVWNALFKEHYWNEEKVVLYAFYLSYLEADKRLTQEDTLELYYPVLATLTHEYEPTFFINKKSILNIINESYPELADMVFEQYQKIKQLSFDDIKNPRNIDFFDKWIITPIKG